MADKDRPTLSELHLKIVRFFHENQASIDTPRGVSTWVREERSKVSKALEELVKLNYSVVGVDVLRYFWEYKSPEQAAADLAKLMAYYRQTWDAENFVLAGYSFGADILPAVYNRLLPQDQANIPLLVLLAPAERASFEIHVSGWLGQDAGELAVAPEVAVIPKNKLLCIYGKEERDERGCTALDNSAAEVVELPGGHHFDQDYPKLTRRILAVYHSHGID